MTTSPRTDVPLLFWNFDNVMSDRGVSISVGVPADPTVISGFVSQTGGGPAEIFGDGVGTVLLTRHLGSNDVFLWFTVERPVFLAGLTFRHWHNHNPGYPTSPSYRVQLQLDSGDGYGNIGEPLELSAANSGRTDTVEIGRELAPGGYKLRWHPKGLKNKGRDTSSEFFALKDLGLNGHVLDRPAAPPVSCAGPVADAPCAVSPAAPVGGYVDVEVAGVTVERLKVMAAKYGGRCSRTGQEFEAGATIGFKHRDALSDEQKAAIFGTKRPAHLMVLVQQEENAPAEEPTGGEPVPCEPDEGRLAPFRGSVARTDPGDEWLYGNLSSVAVAYSCGCLTRDKLDHRHDPGELVRCRRLAHEAAGHLRAIRLNDEGDGAPFQAYFAVAATGAPVPGAVDEALARALFGGTISNEVPVRVEPMNDNGWWWESLVNNHWIPRENAALRRSWNEFMRWFRAVPGLRAHSFVMIGVGDDEPGAVKPRLVVALTAAGSLVGAASSVVYA